RAGGSLIYVIEGFNAFVSQQNVAGISVLGLNFIPTGALLNGVAGPGNITTCTIQFGTSGAGNPTWTVAGVFTPKATTATPCCDSPLNAGANSNPCPILAVDPDFRRPYGSSWNLSVQHPFNNNISLQVAYVGSHGTGLMGLNDINAPTLG